MFYPETRILLLLFNVFFICLNDFKTDAAKNSTNVNPSNISLVIDFSGNEKREAINDPFIFLTIRGFPPGNATEDRIVPRSSWRRKEALILKERSKEADIVIADDWYSNISGEGIVLIQRLEENEITIFGSLLSNFYIGDNGEIYEGLGWEHWNDLINGGLGYRSIIVRIIKTGEKLSEAATRTYKEFLETAICKGILSPRYKLIMTGIIWDYSGKNYENNEISNLDHYVGNLDFIFTDEEKDEGLFSVSVRKEWTKDELPEDLFITQLAIERIYVCDLGPRCFNYHGCIQAVKFLNKSFLWPDFSEKVNFVIGEDGGIYEVTGWKVSHKHLLIEKSMQVFFAGTFDRYAPRHRAMIAFHRLLKLGIWLGKVSPKYKLFKLEDRFSKVGRRLISEFRNELQSIVKLAT